MCSLHSGLERTSRKPRGQNSFRVAVFVEELLAGSEEIELGDKAVEAGRVVPIDHGDDA